MLKEAAPGVTGVAAIFNPKTQPYATFFNRAIEATAPSFGMTVTLAPVHDDSAIEAAITAQSREPGGALIALPDSFNATHCDVIIAAAARHSLPLSGHLLAPLGIAQARSPSVQDELIGARAWVATQL